DHHRDGLTAVELGRRLCERRLGGKHRGVRDHCTRSTAEEVGHLCLMIDGGDIVTATQTMGKHRRPSNAGHKTKAPHRCGAFAYGMATALSDAPARRAAAAPRCW